MQSWSDVRLVTMRELCKRALVMGALIACAMAVDAAAQPAPATVPAGPEVALYYQSDLPVDELAAFDLVIVDPARAALPDPARTPHTQWLARVNLRRIAFPADGSATEPLAQHIQGLLQQGYAGILLDDGAELSGGDTGGDASLAFILQLVRERMPSAMIYLRNHIRLAQTHAAQIDGLVLDSLYGRSGGYGGFLGRVPEEQRRNVLADVARLRAHGNLPIVAVDYCPESDLQCRRDRARRLEDEGLIPFVTAPGLGLVGVGRIEVMPRKIMMVTAVAPDNPLDMSSAAYVVAMPLNYLGYDLQYVDVNKGLPSEVKNDRYAGIVVSLDIEARDPARWRAWLLERVRDGIRIAIVNRFGFPLDAQTADTLGLQSVPLPSGLVRPPEVVHSSPLFGFEFTPTPDARNLPGIRVGQEGTSWVRVKSGDQEYDLAGLMPWGGFALAPYGMVALDTREQVLWTVQPLEFFRLALGLPRMPVPDLTSENGRRLMFTHVDGDGFASKGEFARARGQFSGQILYNNILTRYPIPMMVSVIEGEVGPEGKYPRLAPQLEPLARKIFRLPNVEIGTHTYSHPFFLWEIDNETGKRIPRPPELMDEGPFAMEIPGYTFDVEREIIGSANYINRNLAPPDKRVEAVLWPGDASAPRIALEKAAEIGLLNINGGDTIITHSNPTWTSIAPYGVAKGDRPQDYQVYAATMNENVYTHDWLGPYYGYRRVLETFEMTNRPIRFKAVNIYYHFYSATKLASMKALHTVFDAVLKQPVFPIYTTEYIRKAIDWRTVSVARTRDGWRVRSGPHLRQLRWSGEEIPDLRTASGVSGYLAGPGGLYIHMGSDESTFRMVAANHSNPPHIAQAAGFVRDFRRTGGDMSFEFAGYYQPFVELSGGGRCRAVVDGRAVGGLQPAAGMRITVPAHVAKPLPFHSIKVNCE